jgi:hypothetical protein
MSEPLRQRDFVSYLPVGRCLHDPTRLPGSCAAETSCDDRAKRDGDITGEYIVKKKGPSGELTLVPDIAYPSVVPTFSGRPATSEEFAAFEAEYGPFLPSDVFARLTVKRFVCVVTLPFWVTNAVGI